MAGNSNSCLVDRAIAIEVDVNAPEFRLTPEVIRVIAQRAQLGDLDWEISGRLGCDLQSLHGICAKHGIAVKTTDYPFVEVSIGFDRNGLERFAREAVSRGTSPLRLASECLDLIVRDNLFVAILDK